MTAVESPPVEVGERSLWRAVAVPAEHGGWGLTLEPVLLGVVIAWSWPGLAIGVAAFLAFLVRTPLKLALVDRRRRRWLPRTRVATQVAAVELVLMAALAGASIAVAGPTWLVPVAVAVPLVAVESWFDVRSRGRRLVPELCGAVGIAAVAAAIVVADDGGAALAAAVWMVLAARSIASIPYVRTQIGRMRRRPVSLLANDAFQVAGVALAAVAVVVDGRVAPGTGVVVLAALGQSLAVRRPGIAPVKVVGLRQMAIGLAVVAATAIGVLA